MSVNGKACEAISREIAARSGNVAIVIIAKAIEPKGNFLFSIGFAGPIEVTTEEAAVILKAVQEGLLNETYNTSEMD